MWSPMHSSSRGKALKLLQSLSAMALSEYFKLHEISKHETNFLVRFVLQGWKRMCTGLRFKAGWVPRARTAWLILSQVWDDFNEQEALDFFFNMNLTFDDVEQNRNLTQEHDIAYERSLVRFFTYSGVRLVQCVVGVVGNLMTLIVLANLRRLSNGHLLMRYLAITDILLSLIAPFATYTYAARKFSLEEEYWSVPCVVKEFFYVWTVYGSFSVNVTIGVDR